MTRCHLGFRWTWRLNIIHPRVHFVACKAKWLSEKKINFMPCFMYFAFHALVFVLLFMFYHPYVYMCWFIFIFVFWLVSTLLCKGTTQDEVEIYYFCFKSLKLIFLVLETCSAECTKYIHTTEKPLLFLFPLAREVHVSENNNKMGYPIYVWYPLQRRRNQLIKISLVFIH